ncbi:delta(1)-pyrroline-2-carboxylate reductase family protein [Advenella sp. RU8]|uniref:delta(1)-pyrroline-2-carboxylate reductase family protein n=1 Tax=Advenella sp. RU8 TaxID=3399575 RepID=UPI003AB09036
MSQHAVQVFDAQQTAGLIGFAELVGAIREMAIEYAAGKVQCPDRQVLPVPGNEDGGVLLSMPAAAEDILAHKLISLLPGNPGNGLPTIQGTVTVLDSKTGSPLFVLDAPTVTAWRTAALSMLGLERFTRQPPEKIVLMGAGIQAAAHVRAINALYPQATIYVAGRASSAARVKRFCEHFGDLSNPVKAVEQNNLPDDFDAVITLTTATEPIYHAPAQVGRLIIAVGAFQPHMCEIAPQTVMGSTCYVDDPVGALHEAGDYIRAKKDWSEVISLEQALQTEIDFSRPIMFKTVGIGAWDLAAARVAYRSLGTRP